MRAITQLLCTITVHYFVCEEEPEDLFDDIDHVHVGQRAAAARYPADARVMSQLGASISYWRGSLLRRPSPGPLG